MQRALRDSVVVVKGGTSNRAFLLEMLSRPEVKHAEVDIGWLDRLAAKGEHLSRSYADVALVQAAIEAYDRNAGWSRHSSTLLRCAAGLRFEARSATLSNCAIANTPIPSRSIASDFSNIGWRWMDRASTPNSTGSAHSNTGSPRSGSRFHVVSVEQGSSYRIEVDGVSHRIDRDDGGVVRAPSPAVVVSIAVKPGDMVSTGDRLAVLEAMKMEMQVVAPFSGKSSAGNGHSQRAGRHPALLCCRLNPLRDRKTTAATQAGLLRHVIALAEVQTIIRAGATIWKSCGSSCWASISVPSGRRVCSRNGARLPDASAGQRRDAAPGRRNPQHLRGSLLAVPQQSQGERPDDAGEAPSTEAYLFSYLRMLDTHGEEFPEDFVAALSACGRSLRGHDARSFAGAGRKPALDLQVAPAAGAADSAHYGRAGTATGRWRATATARRGGLSHSA